MVLGVPILKHFRVFQSYQDDDRLIMKGNESLGALEPRGGLELVAAKSAGQRLIL